MTSQDQQDEAQIPNSENPNSVLQQQQQNDQITYPNSQSQISEPAKTLTLETPDSPISHSPHQSVDDDQPDEYTAAAAVYRRGGGGGGGGGRNRKKKKLRPAFERKAREKLKYLMENIKPVPFKPAKNLDFAAHEALLRRVGLWDFVNLEFDSSIRVDLVCKLIATYIPKDRCSYVNDVRVGVNRADLARALKLPVKREKVDVEVPESQESIAFIENFVSNWMLLQEDLWIMPDEILNWNKFIKEGHFEKVDWAGMIWFMVEKELGATQLTECYYASHLHQLIKTQREGLLKEGPNLEVDVKDETDVKDEVDGKEGGEEEEEEGGCDVKMDEAEELQRHEVSGCDVKMDDAQNLLGHEAEEKSIELSLGQENVEKDQGEMEGNVKEDVMDCDRSKRDEMRRWLIDGKNEVGRHHMQPCGESSALNVVAEKKPLGLVNDVDDVYNDTEEEGQEGDGVEEGEEDNDNDDDDEGGEEEEGFDIMQKCDGMEGLSSANLIQAMEAHNAFSSGLQFRDNLSNDFMLSRVDTDAVAGSSLFGDGGKRHPDHVADMSHHSLNASKRPRMDEPTDFHMCMDQIQQWFGKARMMYEEKEQAFTHASIQHHGLIGEIQQRDAVIGQLHKARMEDQHKSQTQIHRLNHELYMMAGLLDSYRKALKETHRAFAEYRAHCPLPEDEQLYKDVSGAGGLVLSTMELEKQRVKREEEERLNRLIAEKMTGDFESIWVDIFERCVDRVNQVDCRLLGTKQELNLLKEMLAKRKAEALGRKDMEVSERSATEHTENKDVEVSERSATEHTESKDGEVSEGSATEHTESKDVEVSERSATEHTESKDVEGSERSATEHTESKDVEGSERSATEHTESKDVEMTERNASEQVESETAAVAEAVECSGPTEGVECSVPTEGVECSSPTAEVECSAPTAEGECSAPTEVVECSLKEATDSETVEEQS